MNSVLKYFIVVFCLSAVGMISLSNISNGDKSVLTSDLFQFDTFDNLPYITPTPGEIPIIASSPWVEGRTSSLEELADIKVCGFNVVLSLTSLSHFKRVSPLLKEVGLKAIIGFPEFSTNNWQNIIDTLKYHSEIGGWRIWDEPKSTDFKSLKKLYDEIVHVDPLHMAYINLVGPEGGQNFFGKGGDYEKYLVNFQKDFRPGIWSYDLYPISVKDSKVKVNYSSFYDAFEIYSQLSKITRRPFWAYCQSMAYASAHQERPAATVATLSFEAFSALGYGAKGLVYWTYCLRKSNERETYKSALVDLNCKKTKAWYAAQQVNGEIHALNDVFMSTRYEDTWHTGQSINPKCKNFINGVGCINTLEGGKTGFQVSLLESDTANYMVIVNKDIEHSQKISLTFSEDCRVVLLSPVKKSAGYSVVEKTLGRNYSAKVPSGRYLILQYNKIH